MSIANLSATFAELIVNPAFMSDPKWQARVEKAMTPLDLEDRIKSQLYTAARKQLDTEAMTISRRTKVFKLVTEDEIKALFQEKYNDYLDKKAEKTAKANAFAGAGQ